MGDTPKGITKIRNGKYRVRISVGRKADGRTRRQPSRIVYGTLNDAVTALEELQEENRPYSTDGPHTFDDLFRIWDEQTAARKQRNEMTVYLDRGLYTNHIKPAIGDIPLTALRISHLNNLYDDLIPHLAPASIRKVHRKICAVLNFGVRNEYINRNVATHAEPPRVPNIDPYAPTMSDVQESLQHMKQHDPELWLYLRLTATIGVRRGELPALIYGDVNFDDNSLNIHRSVNNVPGHGMLYNDTKTGQQGHGILTIDPELMDVIAQRRKLRLQDAISCGISIDDVMLFPGKDLTTPIRPDSISQKITRYFNQHQHLPRFTLRNLRSFVATELEHSGFTLLTARAVLRHTSIATTGRYYAAARTLTARTATSSIGEALGRDEQGKKIAHRVAN